MYLRDQPTTTLVDVADEWTNRSSTWGGGLHNVSVRLDEEQPRIILGQHEVSATKKGVDALANFLKVPTAFLNRLERDEQQWILERRLERSAESDLSVTYTTDGGITDVLQSSQRRILPEQFVDVATSVMPPESIVTDHWIGDNLQLDVIVPDGFKRGIGGDPNEGEHTWNGEARVGDITHGGLRFYQNRKQNLAPGVQPLIYRLRCTNGMELPDQSIRVDARGMDVEEIMVSLRHEAIRAFNRVESDIASFYDLRNQPVEGDRTGTLRRIALDAGLPARTVGVLEDLLPSSMEDVEHPSMFDLVNVITNYANHASGRNARVLQRVGGSMVNDHAERCGTCHQRVLN